VAGDACSRPRILIRFHDLHAGDIREVVGEINSYLTRGTSSLPSLVITGYMSFLPLFGLPFCLPCDASDHQGFLLGFLGFLLC
jgi:hypothetical protein